MSKKIHEQIAPSSDVPDEERREARYLFDPDSIRDAEEPPEDSARLVWMFLRLLRTRDIDYATFSKEFRRGEKTFGRDVAKLRTIGKSYGFTLSRQTKGRVTLVDDAGMPDPRKKASGVAADTLRAVAEALGELVSNDVFAAIDTASAPNDPFLRLAVPRLIDETSVARVYTMLRDAWRHSARVRFRYPRNVRLGEAKLEERIVEPHLVTFYDGRYYLVAYDARPGTAAWRQFALDRIVEPIARSGTFVRRVVPLQYRGEDALGLFKSEKSTEVTISISPSIAASVLARRWQRNQRVSAESGGWRTVTFEVFDVAEVVRWAFGFGDRARVLGPPTAVSLARDLATTLVNQYSSETAEEA